MVSSNSRGLGRSERLSALILLLVLSCTCPLVNAQPVAVLKRVVYRNSTCDSGIDYRVPLYPLGPTPTFTGQFRGISDYASVDCDLEVVNTTRISQDDVVVYSSTTNFSCIPTSGYSPAMGSECAEYDSAELLQMLAGDDYSGCPTESSGGVFLTVKTECTPLLFGIENLGGTRSWITTVESNNVTIREFNDSFCQNFQRNLSTTLGECLRYPISFEQPDSSSLRLVFRQFNFSNEFPTESRSPTVRPTYATFSPVAPTTFAPVPAVTNRPTVDRGYIYAYYTNDPHLFRYKYSGNGQILSSSYITCNGTGWRTFAQSSAWIVRVHETSRFFGSGSASSVDAVQVQMLVSTNDAVMLDSSEGITGWTSRQVGAIQVTEKVRSTFSEQPYINKVEVALSDLKLTISRFPWSVQSGAFVFAPLNVALLSGSVAEGIAVDGCPLDGFAISVGATGRRQLQGSSVPIVTVSANPACANVDELFRDACNYDVFATNDVNFATATVKASETFNEVKLRADQFYKEGNAAVLSLFRSIVVLFFAVTFVM